MAETMTARQRVMAALNHQQPDRVPRDLGGTVSSGISIDACEKLYRYLDFKEPAQILPCRQKTSALC